MPARLSDFPIRFGTSGARGLVTELTEAYCSTFTRAFLSILGPSRGRLLVGHDLRDSSPPIAAACMAAAEDAGVECLLAGAVPTPALALAGRELDLPAIMVTGSHIPADRNGLKAYRPEGEISKSDEQAMLAAAVSDLPAPPGRFHRAVGPSILRRYVNRYRNGFGPHALAGLRIGVYEHSSVARDVMHEILQLLGAETIGFGRSESFVAVDTEAVRPEDHELARQWAREHRCDAIISTDGDADRPFLADEEGRWLRGDLLGILASLELGAQTVATPVSSNTALERSGRVGKILRTRIGSPHVIAAMEQDSNPPPVAGFEANGGFLLGSDIVREGRVIKALPTRDAMLPLLLALSAAKARGLRISQLTASLPPRFTASDRIGDVPAEMSQRLLAELECDTVALQTLLAPGSGTMAAIERSDGLRVSFANGDIVHLRASGNAPELRCYAEADDQAHAEALCAGCLGRVALMIRNR